MRWLLQGPWFFGIHCQTSRRVMPVMHCQCSLPPNYKYWGTTIQGLRKYQSGQRWKPRLRMIYPKKFSIPPNPKIKEFPKRLETKLSVPNRGVLVLVQNLSKKISIPPFTEFPSVLRFFRDGITQANAAPVTSSLTPSRWWQERWKVSYKLFELTGSVKNTWMKFLQRKKRCFRLFITSNKLLPPFFLSVALPPLLRGFFAPFFHLPTPRKEPKNWKTIS